MDNLVVCSVLMVMLVVEIEDEVEVFNLNVVKVIIDKSGYVLYFSCVMIFWDCDNFVKVDKVIV